MTFRDMQLVLRSIKRRAKERTGFFWWDEVNPSKFEDLATKLSITDTSEKGIIREELMFSKAKTVLDAACGTGSEYQSYQKGMLEVDYTGMDLSQRMLKIANTHNPAARFITGDVQHMPFQDSSFDAVVMKHILEHLPSFETAVNEAVRVAKNTVIIDLFHMLLPMGMKVKCYHTNGYWENWYSKTPGAT